MNVEKFGLGQSRTLAAWEKFLEVDWSGNNYTHCHQYYDERSHSWRPIAEVERPESFFHSEREEREEEEGLAMSGGGHVVDVDSRAESSKATEKIL